MSRVPSNDDVFDIVGLELQSNSEDALFLKHAA